MTRCESGAVAGGGLRGVAGGCGRVRRAGVRRDSVFSGVGTERERGSGGRVAGGG
jgi:hypothetical protein